MTSLPRGRAANGSVHGSAGSTGPAGSAGYDGSTGSDGSDGSTGFSAARRRRAVAAVGAVSAGLLALSACDKPTPLATITVGDNSVSSETDCYNDGKEVKTDELTNCLKSKDIKSITVDPDETVRFGVDPDIADKGWTILMNGQPLTDSSTKTYRTIPGSVFFNEQYGASGNSTLVSIKEGDTTVSGLWSFTLKKDS